MEKAVNRLLVVTAVLAVAFAAIAYSFRGAQHGEAAAEDRLVPFCEYIEVDILRLDVTVIPYDGEKIRVNYCNDTPLDISIGDNSLTITESDRFVISVFAGESEHFGLYLYLPREIYREIEIFTGSGKVRVGGVDSEKVTVITGSGDVQCEDTRSLTCILTGTGNAVLDFDYVIPESSVQTRSGNAQILFPQGSSVALDFETVDGECVTDLISGRVFGSYLYSFNGGGTLIHAATESGTLTVSEHG